MKINIPVNVPVFISDTESCGNGKFTKAKLKIFYEGETVDHRLFTKEFSDELLKTLPYTPVVGYYDEDEEDFKGHNKTQYIYGLVPENPQISEEYDDTTKHTFKTTDIYLYTERQDNIGEVAKKIIGKQHSLELNPTTLNYKVNRDAFGRFKNIEFISGGEFVGLSVLGDSEKPAFDGSSFFSSMDDSNFSAFQQSLDKYVDYLKNNSGGSMEIQVENEVIPSGLEEFIKHSLEEVKEGLYRSLQQKYSCCWIVQTFDDKVVFTTYDEQGSHFYRCGYAVDGEDYLLGELEEVKQRFYTDDEIQEIENAVAQMKKCGKKEDCAEDESEKKEPEDEEDMECKKDKKASCDSDEGDIEDAAKKKCGQAEETVVEQVVEPAASASAAALTDAEREELEQYRKQAKLNSIESYKEDLPQETLDAFAAKVDEYTKDELEIQLAIEYRKFSVLSKNTSAAPKVINTVQFYATAGETGYDETDPEQVIKKYKYEV